MNSRVVIRPLNVSALLAVCLILTQASGTLLLEAGGISAHAAAYDTTYAVDDEPEPMSWRAANGVGVNPTHLEWGSTGSILGRAVPAAHGDNISSLAGPNRPGPREISNAVCATPGSGPADETGLSDYNWLWGQFITHDIDFTTTSNGRTTDAVEFAHIPVPVDDPIMNPNGVEWAEMMFFRSVYLEGTGTSENNPREHPNNITTWIDASVIYGSTQGRADWLRTYEGGLLKVSNWTEGDLLPLAEPDDATAPGMSFAGFSGDKKFVTGDVRANEHIALLAMHVIFHREHNRLADDIAARNPDWSDEQIYQRARKIVAAEIGVITFDGFLPSLGITMPAYSGFNASMDPAMRSVFATVAFRMGHSQIGDNLLRLQDDRSPIAAGNLKLKDGFWTTSPVTDEGGVDPLLRGLAANTQPANDLLFGDNLRNQLFGFPGGLGADLCAIDIQRGRDHGVPDYNTIRVAFGLPALTNFSQISSDNATNAELEALYGDIDDIDPLIGMLAEDHPSDGVLGETMKAVIMDQFVRIRDGDSHWWEADPELESIRDDLRDTTLSDVILRNTDIRDLQCDVFFAETNVNNMDCGGSGNNAPHTPAQYVSSNGEPTDGTEIEGESGIKFDPMLLLIGGMIAAAVVLVLTAKEEDAQEPEPDGDDDE